MHIIRFFIVVLSLVSLGLVSVQAGVPNIVNYQGTIKDSDGMLLTGAHDLEFSIYGSESGGDALWTESHSGVAFENGVFSVDLGEGTAFPLDLFDQPDRWIGMTVDNDVEMSPRMRFTSTPFSMRASIADTALSNGSGGDGHSLDAADGDPVDALFVDNDGNVLIGAPGDSLSEKGLTLDGKLVAVNWFTGGELATADYGVYGWTGLFGGLAGVKGENSNGNWGQLGGDNGGAFGQHSNGNWGRLGGENYAVYGDGDCKFNNGKTTVDILEIQGGSDISERFVIGDIGDDLAPSPGMVVSIDPGSSGRLAVCRTFYDKKVAGVISGAGGIETGMLMGQKGTIADGEHPVALNGRVYVLADASFGAIQPGDLLTSSSTPGHAMKATDRGQSQGAIIGKAMTALDSGQGLVLVLVSLQ